MTTGTVPSRPAPTRPEKLAPNVNSSRKTRPEKLAPNLNSSRKTRPEFQLVPNLNSSRKTRTEFLQIARSLKLTVKIVHRTLQSKLPKQKIGPMRIIHISMPLEVIGGRLFEGLRPFSVRFAIWDLFEIQFLAARYRNIKLLMSRVTVSQ